MRKHDFVFIIFRHVLISARLVGRGAVQVERNKSVEMLDWFRFPRNSGSEHELASSDCGPSVSTTGGFLSPPVQLDAAKIGDEATPSSSSSSSAPPPHRRPPHDEEDHPSPFPPADRSSSDRSFNRGSFRARVSSFSRQLSRKLVERLEKSPPFFNRVFGKDISAAIQRNVVTENFPTKSPEELSALRVTWATKLAHFTKYGSCSGNNRVDILETGDNAYPAMLEAIEKAKNYVLFETYIMDDSRVADIFVEALCSAAKRGVRVWFMVDGIGGRDMTSAQRNKLDAHGIAPLQFNPPNFFVLDSWKAVLTPHAKPIGPFPFRDHRKILICDGRVGFCGSMNVMREDCAPEPYGGIGGFYDIQVRIMGPAVRDLAAVFVDSLVEGGHADRAAVVEEVMGSAERSSAAERSAGADEAFSSEPDTGGAYVQVVRSNVRWRGRDRSLQKVLSKALYGALDSIHITTPYFFPPLFLRHSLYKQLRNPHGGASMSLLLSGISDVHPIPYDTLGQRHVIRKLLVEHQRRAAGSAPARAGAEGGNYTERNKDSADSGDAAERQPPSLDIYLSENDHMHAKVVVVDSLFTSVGSYNFDWFSGRRNLEVGVCVFDHRLARKFEEIHQRKIREGLRDKQLAEQHGCDSSAGIDAWTDRNPYKLVAGHHPEGGASPAAGSGSEDEDSSAAGGAALYSTLRPVRRAHLDQWEFANIWPRAVSFWAYNSVWFPSSNIFDDLDSVGRLKRQMRRARSGFRRLTAGGTTSREEFRRLGSSIKQGLDAVLRADDWEDWLAHFRMSGAMT